MTLPRFTPRTLMPTLAVAAAGLVAAGASAADSTWLNTAGGDFGNLANWDLGVPGLGDTAIFTASSTYAVSFALPTAIGTLALEEGNITFALGGLTFTVEETFLGNNITDIGILTLSNGTFAVTSLDPLAVRLGKDPGAVGELIVPGGALFTTTEDLVVGDGGPGTLRVTTGGDAQAALVFVGDDALNEGTVEVNGTGSTLTASAAVSIGNFGSGDYTISGAGTATHQAITRIGDELGADGTLTVTGPGSTWNANGETFVGNVGTGTIDANGGATVNSTRMKIGDERGSVGTVTVSGGGTTWTDTVEIFVGNFGDGTLTVSGGATLNGVAATLADDPGSVGAATVTGTGSTWDSTGALRLGDLGTGTLTVSNGASAGAASIALGVGAGSSGTLRVRDAGSTVTSAGAVGVGDGLGTGTLRVRGGGRLFSQGGHAQGTNGTLEIVLDASSADMVTVTGTAFLAGALDVSFDALTPPPVGAEIAIVTAGARSGTFGTVSLASGLTLLYEPARVVIRVDAAPCLGDLDESGAIGFADLNALLTDWGPCPGCPGDFDGSDAVGFADLNILLTAWGACP